MSDEDFAAEIDKTDMILAEALQQFQTAKVNPYIYGMALLEIGVAALIKVGGSESVIMDTVKKLDMKVRSGMVDE